MSRSARLLLTAGAAVALGVLSAPQGAAASAAGPAVAVAAKPVTSFSFVSAPGDYVGGGQTRNYTSPTTKITVSGTAEGVSVSVDAGAEWWSAEIDAPRGERLHPGVFNNAERAPFRTGRAPGLDVGGSGRGCNQIWGSFAVDQIATDAGGAVTLFDATFTQRCDSATAPTLKGTIRYNALPLSYSFKSDPGDYIGGGVSKSYENSTSTFDLRGTTTHLSFGVSGKRDGWSVELAPPAGQTLNVGTYADAQRWPFQQAGHPGLSVDGNGRGCNQLTGTFTILDLGTDAQGNITALSATLTQHCEGSAPALNATIHYHA